MTAPATRPAGSPFDRAMRGSAFVVLGYAGSQGLRFGANLILTRLLFPEAFGVMALVSVILVGLAMFSDIGIGPSIMQHRRGDDPAFLNTAWSLQIIRGAALWAVTIVIAAPVAAFYDAPLLAELLPVAGLTLLIAGFNPTRIETAGRHLILGRATTLDLLSQVVGTAAIMALAWVTGSVWSLVIGAVIGSLAKLVLMHLGLPGHVDRPGWEAAARRDLIRFGKWIFLSTVCGFVLSQQDKVILGRYLTLEALGVYNIGFFLASFPVQLAGALTGRMTIPLYRELLASGDPATAARLRRLRAGLTAGLIAALLALGLAGPALVGVLYDPRYAAAGVVLVAIACVNVPAMVFASYDQVALAAGESRQFFNVLAVRAVLQVGLYLVGVELAGLAGALAGQALAHGLAYPLFVALARRHGVWDPRHDAVAWAVGLAGVAAVLLVHRSDLGALVAFGGG